MLFINNINYQIMFKPLNLRKLMDENRVKKVTFYQSLGISKTQLDNILNGKSLPGSDKLEMMANYFNVPIDYFFDRDSERSILNIGNTVSGNGNNIDNYSMSECQKEVEHLKAILEEKEAVIAEKERTIQILLNKL